MDNAEGEVVSTEVVKIKLPHLMTNPVNSAHKPDESKLELKNKIQRVRNLISEYDEDEDRFRNQNPELHDFVQKVKVVLNAEADVTKNDKISFSNSELNENEPVAGSSSSVFQIDCGDLDNNPNPKVIEALGIHVVLTEIFKYGSFRDLKNFRLINKQWKGVANSAIIQRRLWKLSIHEKFGAISNNRSEAVLKLNDCIEASGGSFPLTGLDFSDVNYYNNLDEEALLRFYALIGQSIKHVRFSNFGPLSTSEFQDLLVSKMPNVNDIEAGKIVFTNQEECHAPIVLPYLETIVFIGSNDAATEIPFKVLPYYSELLRSAKNLKEIIYFRVELIDTVIEIGKMNCIQSFNYALKLGKSEICVKFSHTEPKLTLLNVTRNSLDPFDDDDEEFMLSPELAQSLKRILISSKDTLKHLVCMPRVFPVDFKLPKFENLQFLTVYDLENEWYDDQLPPPRVFPAETECSEIFPNLHTVTLDTPPGKREAWYQYFPDQEFLSVKNVIIEDNYEFEGSLKAHFPNASHIKIINFQNIISRTQEHELFNGGFHLELDNQIESLELHQCLLAPLGPEYHLDPLFTGVPAYICKKLLQKHNNNQAKGEDENIMAVKEILKLVQTQHYAFRNSKGLRRLKLNFNHQDNASFRVPRNSNSDSDSEDSSHSLLGVELEQPTPVISPVSCVYGFSLMPNLKQVIIGYDHYLPNASDIAQVFKPFAEFPYITIVHEPTIELESDE